MRYYEVSNQEEFDQFLVELESYIEEGMSEGIHLELLRNNYVTSKPIDIPSNFTLSGNNSEIRLVTEVEDWKNKGIIDAKGTEDGTLNNIYIENIKVTTDKILGGGEALPRVTGIKFDYVTASKLEGLKVNGKRHGIQLNDSSNNDISGIKCTNNGDRGIYLSYSTNNNISEITCTDNKLGGIYLSSSSNNVISGITCTDNTGSAIYLANAFNNIVSGNVISNNAGSGIYLANASSNVITGNVISNNTGSGIYLTETVSNSVSYLNLTRDNVNGSYKNEGTGNVLSDEYNQFLDKVEG